MKITIDVEKFINLTIKACILDICINVNEKRNFPQNTMKKIVNRVQKSNSIQNIVREFKLKFSGQVPKSIL